MTDHGGRYPRPPYGPHPGRDLYSPELYYFDESAEAWFYVALLVTARCIVQWCDHYVAVWPGQAYPDGSQTASIASRASLRPIPFRREPRLMRSSPMLDSDIGRDRSFSSQVATSTCSSLTAFII